MLVIDCANFDPEYPEQFTWGHLYSHQLASVAADITNRIEHDLRTANRILTPGLRDALRAIAEIATV